LGLGGGCEKGVAQMGLLCGGRLLMGRNIRVRWSLTWWWGGNGTAVEVASALRRAYSGEEDDEV